MKFSAKEFDRFLSENAVRPTCVFLNPVIYSGYWCVDKPLPLKRALRWLGRKLKSRRIYWLGLRVHWQEGLKEIVDLHVVDVDI